MEHLDLWPVGAEVETIVSLPGHVAAGQNKHGVTNWVTGIRVPAGERGRVTYHIDDGRICCQFDCDEKCGHTFGEPEKFLKLVSVPVEHIDQLRAALAAVTAERDELAAALRPFAVVGRQVQPSRGISPDVMWLWRRTSSGHPEAEFGITLEDCQRAAQALTALEK